MAEIEIGSVRSGHGLDTVWTRLSRPTDNEVGDWDRGRVPCDLNG
jgi:hypothetical protein